MFRKKIAYVLVRIILWVILPLVCVEFVMIVLDPYLFKNFYEYDPDLGFRVRAYAPGADGALTNQFGFNDRDYPLQKTPGTTRLLVLGDSFGWAGGRDGNYTALLERMFERRDGQHKIDVINACYPATHPGDQLALLKKYGLQYDPDVVMLGFFVGNDFLAVPGRKRIIVNGLYVYVNRNAEYKFLGYPIIPQSRLYLFVKQQYRVYTESKRAAEMGQYLPGQGLTLSEETFLEIERARLEFFNVNPSARGSFQPGIDYVLQSISEMDAILRARGAKFVVAIYPDEFQVNKSLLKRIFEKYELRAEDYDLNRAQNLLKSFLRSKGIPFVDLTDRFRAEGDKRELYILRNTHWNDAGNQFAANVLFEGLPRQVESLNPAR